MQLNTCSRDLAGSSCGRGSVLLSPTSLNFLIAHWNISEKKYSKKYSSKFSRNSIDIFFFCSLKEKTHSRCVKVLYSLWHSTLTNMLTLQNKVSNFTAFEFLQCGQMPHGSINQQKSESILWVVILPSGIWFGLVEFVNLLSPDAEGSLKSFIRSTVVSWI